MLRSLIYRFPPSYTYHKKVSYEYQIVSYKSYENRSRMENVFITREEWNTLFFFFNKYLDGKRARYTLSVFSNRRSENEQSMHDQKLCVRGVGVYVYVNV